MCVMLSIGITTCILVSNNLFVVYFVYVSTAASWHFVAEKGEHLRHVADKATTCCV